MAKPDKHEVKIELLQEQARQHCWADSYSVEKDADRAIIHFGVGRQMTHSICISKDSVDNQRKPLEEFIERLGLPVGKTAEQTDFRNDSLILPADAMQVSRRGPEGEFQFFCFSLHELVSPKKGGDGKAIPAHPLLLVRCPATMMTEVMFRLLDPEIP